MTTEEILKAASVVAAFGPQWWPDQRRRLDDALAGKVTQEEIAAACDSLPPDKNWAAEYGQFDHPNAPPPHEGRQLLRRYLLPERRYEWACRRPAYYGPKFAGTYDDFLRQER